MSLNDFNVQSKLGEGAYSSVHKVKRISDGQIYALKKVQMMHNIGQDGQPKRKIKTKCP